jgi:hypothetical protein
MPRTLSQRYTAYRWSCRGASFRRSTDTTRERLIWRGSNSGASLPAIQRKHASPGGFMAVSSTKGPW